MAVADHEIKRKAFVVDAVDHAGVESWVWITQNNGRSRAQQVTRSIHQNLSSIVAAEARAFDDVKWLANDCIVTQSCAEASDLHFLQGTTQVKHFRCVAAESQRHVPVEVLGFDWRDGCTQFYALVTDFTNVDGGRSITSSRIQWRVGDQVAGIATVYSQVKAQTVVEHFGFNPSFVFSVQLRLEVGVAQKVTYCVALYGSTSAIQPGSGTLCQSIPSLVRVGETS